MDTSLARPVGKCARKILSLSAEPTRLHAVYRKAAELSVALGGPDLLPHKPGQMFNSYPLLREYAGKFPTGIAVQDGNQGYRNPKTQKQVSTAELVDFATNYLKVGYLFWCMEEPYYSHDVLPYFRVQLLDEPGVAERMEQQR